MKLLGKGHRQYSLSSYFGLPLLFVPLTFAVVVELLSASVGALVEVPLGALVAVVVTGTGPQPLVASCKVLEVHVKPEVIPVWIQ
jgi:hypothetical protein